MKRNVSQTLPPVSATIKQWRKPVLLLLALPLFLGPLYLFSAGPAIYLAFQFEPDGLPEKTFTAIYGPILDDTPALIEEPFNKYIDWWVTKALQHSGRWPHHNYEIPSAFTSCFLGSQPAPLPATAEP